MRRIWNWLIILAIAFSISGCATACKSRVQSGYLGMCSTPSGFTGEPLSPGWHSCWGAGNKMYYIDTSDFKRTLSMNVLCKDKLNFGFDVTVLMAVNRDEPEVVKEMFSRIRFKDDGNTISADQIYNTYAESTIDQVARSVISKYETADIADNRSEIMKEISKQVKEALDSSIIDVKKVDVNNLDYPPVITKAQEIRAQREIEIETERSEQKKRVLKAENSLKIAELDYKRELVEAAMISDTNKIIGGSITPEYLAWWQLKVMGEAAKGQNNWGFIPYTDFANENMKNIGSGRTVVDTELKRRIKEAREYVTEAEVKKAAGTPEKADKSAKK